MDKIFSSMFGKKNDHSKTQEEQKTQAEFKLIHQMMANQDQY